MQIQIESPLDMHVHFRSGELLKDIVPLTSRTFAGAVAMPNTLPPIDNSERLESYRKAILSAADDSLFHPYMTLFFKDYDPLELETLKSSIIGLKLYPAGITTNSSAGIHNITDARNTFGLIEELGIPLLVHGETGGFVMDREREFIAVYDDMARKFPQLKIIMEHISTREAVEFLDRHENVFATATLHHLLLTMDDLAGNRMNPHLFCKPVVKRPEDREALLEAALEAHPKLMFGSDSAPHPRSSKECSECAAGIFSAPIALQALTELFETHHALENLQAFVSDNAQRIYGITPPTKSVTLTKKAFKVPDQYGTVVPFNAGSILSWSLADTSND